MALCPECGSQIGDDQEVCGSCGAVDHANACFNQEVMGDVLSSDPAGSPRSFLRYGPLGVLVGSVLLAVAPSFAWSKMGAMAWLPSDSSSLSGAETIGTVVNVFRVLGGCGVLLALAVLFLKPSYLAFRPMLRRTLEWGPLVVGVTALGLTLYYYFTAFPSTPMWGDDPTGFAEGIDFLSAMSRGIGIYAALSASVWIIFAAGRPLLSRVVGRMGAGSSDPTGEDR